MYRKLIDLGAGMFMTVLICALMVHPMIAAAADRVQPVGDVVTIVIDPGHGGSNHGTESGHTMEKEMTMITAMAMYEELQKYDNVQVYMTHTTDIDMELHERAEFAKNVNADFLYSIHYNASENHSMYGTEVWISCEKPYNAYGYQFGYQHLESFREMGLFVRGVKNRKDFEKNNDYYGVIRESVARSVPAVIIEHCYVDEERDAEYIKDEEGYKAFGRADALSVARYFGLKSIELGVDYSEAATKLQPASADSVVQSTFQDLTPPEICEISILECDYDTGKISLRVSAADYDSALIYYDYTLDNGQTWSKLETWPGSDTLTGEYTDTFQLNLTIPGGRRPAIAVRAYNFTDIARKSNVITFDQTFSKRDGKGSDTAGVSGNDINDYEEAAAATEPVEHTRNSIGTTTFVPVAAEPEEESGVSILTFLKFCLALVILLFFIVLSTQIVNYKRRKRRRRR